MSEFTIVATGERIAGELIGIVNFFFPRSLPFYQDMPVEDYRALVAAAQVAINDRRISGRLIEDHAETFRQLLGDQNIICEITRLRAVRPNVTAVQEAIGWHRENMYSAYGRHALNVWAPISGVLADSAMQYIPGSAAIPDAQIKIELRRDYSIGDNSPGAAIGLIGTEKHIIGGVDFGSKRPLVIMPGEAAIFSGMLIHGAGHNSTDTIRFSIDFRVLSERNYNEAQGRTVAAGT